MGSNAAVVLDAPLPAADDAAGWEVRLAALEGLSRAVAAERAKAQVGLNAAVARLNPAEPALAAATVAVAQGVSHRSVRTALGWAQPLVDLLPATFGLLRAGIITAGLAQDIARRCKDLTPEQASGVEDRLWEVGRDRSHAQVMRRLRERLALIHGKDPASAGPAEGRDSRDVWLVPGRSGTDTVELRSRLATVDGHAVMASLGARHDREDPRPAAGQRADALVEALTGVGSFAAFADAVEAGVGVESVTDLADVEHAGVPACVRHWTVSVGVPLDVVLSGQGAVEVGTGGSADSVGGVTGRFMALLALRHGGRIARLVSDPWSGELVDSTIIAAVPGAQRPRTASAIVEGRRESVAMRVEPGYEPSAELDRFVRARDRHCQGPGCRTPARHCDIDHIVAYDHDHPALGGQTTASNLVCLCRRDHRVKHSKGWTLKRRPGGGLQWTTPTGRIVDLPPPEHGEVA